jgi:DNA-binding transcriptional LysR family regulator
MADRQVTLRELSKEKFLLTEKGCNYRQVFEEILAEQRLEVKYGLDIGSTNTIIDYVKDELGISLLPEFNLKKDLQKHAISEISVNDCNIVLYIQVILNRHRWVSPSMKAFLSIVSNYF